MDPNYKTTPLYKWTRRCFWLLVLIFLPTYFITRYQNEEYRFGPDFRLRNTLWFIPTHRVTWESYLMTASQVQAFLTKEISPSKILKDRSLPSIDPNGDYYIVFRLKTNQHRVDGGQIKCYVEGAKFPLDLQVYPGPDHSPDDYQNRGSSLHLYRGFKDYIIPVHVDPNEIKWTPHLTIQWTSMYRF